MEFRTLFVSGIKELKETIEEWCSTSDGYSIYDNEQKQWTVHDICCISSETQGRLGGDKWGTGFKGNYSSSTTCHYVVTLVHYEDCDLRMGENVERMADALDEIRKGLSSNR